MTEPLYSVTIGLGIGPDDTWDQLWTLDHNPNHGTATDDVRVLDGLRFGWSMPDDTLWPLQPNPMTAALAVTMPAFDDYPWIQEGAPVMIRVAVRGGYPIASFWGRITDSQAVPRTGRPGVVLSIVAVDYTVDPIELSPLLPPFTVIEDELDSTTLDDVWATALGMGPFPDWPTTTAAVWVEQVPPLRNLIDDVLLTTVSDLEVPVYLLDGDPAGTTDLARSIFAPFIDIATGRPGSAFGQLWAFDLLWKHPRAPRLTVPAKVDRGSFTWARNKRTPPSTVVVTGSPADVVAGTTVTNPALARSWGADVTATLNTISYDAARVAGIADFYLLDTVPRGWAIPTVRWLLTREPDDVLEALPDDLMPCWDRDAGDPSRSSCYGRLVELAGVATHLNPYQATDHPEILGLLSGVDLVISGGQIALDLTIRQLQEDA